MASIRDQIRDYILSKPAIAQSFSQGLINQSALARIIIKDLALEKHVDAVISILRRVDLQDLVLNVNELPEYSVTTKTGLKGAYVTNEQSVEITLFEKQHTITLKPSQTLRTFELTDSVFVVADDKTMNDLNISSSIDVGEIVLHYSEQTNISVLLRVVTSELDLSNVRIHAILAGKNELIVTVNETDVRKVRL